MFLRNVGSLHDVMSQITELFLAAVRTQESCLLVFVGLNDVGYYGFIVWFCSWWVQWLSFLIRALSGSDVYHYRVPRHVRLQTCEPTTALPWASHFLTECGSLVSKHRFHFNRQYRQELTTYFPSIQHEPHKKWRKLWEIHTHQSYFINILLFVFVQNIERCLPYSGI
jgi:hypothetical protein